MEPDLMAKVEKAVASAKMVAVPIVGPGEMRVMVPPKPANPITDRYKEKTAIGSTNRFLYNRSGGVDVQKMVECWRRAMVPPRQAAIKKEFHEHPEWNEYFETVKERCGTGFIVALLGKRGTGKTQLASCMCRYFCEYGHYCLYTTAMEIFISIKETYGNKTQKTERDIINELRAFQLLVIDEFQDRGETDWENRLLTHIIDTRYREVRDTIVIANMDAENFTKSAGPSIASRMVETGGVLDFDWESFRKESM